MENNTIKPVGKAIRAWMDSVKPQDDERHPDGQIIYRVQAYHDGKPVPIKRLGGIDNDGILYIGETDISHRRRSRYRVLVNSFKNTKRKRKHGAAAKYFNDGHDKTWPIDELRVSYKAITRTSKPTVFTAPDGKTPATTAEYSAIRQYEVRFGELPPLNSIRGKKDRAQPTPAKSPESAGDSIEMG